MNRNVGSVDKIIRLIAGIGLVAFGIFGASGTTLGVAGIIIGAVLIGTALLNFCPLFKIFGISSFKQST